MQSTFEKIHVPISDEYIRRLFPKMTLVALVSVHVLKNKQEAEKQYS